MYDAKDLLVMADCGHILIIHCLISSYPTPLRQIVSCSDCLKLSHDRLWLLHGSSSYLSSIFVSVLFKTLLMDDFSDGSHKTEPAAPKLWNSAEHLSDRHYTFPSPHVQRQEDTSFKKHSFTQMCPKNWFLHKHTRKRKKLQLHGSLMDHLRLTAI